MRLPQAWRATRSLLPYALIVWGLQASAQENAELVDVLRARGVTEDQLMDADANGIPRLCGTGESLESPARSAGVAALGLPSGERAFEMIPNVIRPDGVDGLFLEVDTNGPVNGVTMVLGFLFIAPGQIDGFDLTPAPFRDDGLGGDRVAGDFIFTLGPIRYNTAWSLDPFVNAYPDGVAFAGVGANSCLEVEETDTSISRFLLCPEAGLLRGDVPAEAPTSLSPTVQVTPHLINVQTSGRGVQRILRGGSITLDETTHAIYDVLPDSFDFFTFFSMNKIEKLPFTSSSNFVSGVHTWASIDYTGTGLSPQDSTAFWGSAGRLQGLNALDLATRGVQTNNATHELLHQWAAFANAGVLGINENGSHYNQRSSVGSVVGGFLWQDNGDGSFSMLCSPKEGRSGAFTASPLDKYLMGLIDGSLVSPVRVYDSSLPFPSTMCSSGPASFSDITTTVTIQDIQNLHGVRTPGPAGAQRDFRIGFVAESHERLLTPEEMTFYEILAGAYAAPIPLAEPTPYLDNTGWTSIDRYFGEGTTWSTDVFEAAGVPALRGWGGGLLAGLLVITATSVRRHGLRSAPRERSRHRG